MTWGDWMVLHVDLFGLDPQRFDKTFLLWISKIFGPDGFTPEDLNDASLWLSRNAPPRHFPEHLSRLTERLNEVRQEKNRLTERERLRREDEEARANAAPPGTLKRMLKEHDRAKN